MCRLASDAIKLCLVCPCIGYTTLHIACALTLAAHSLPALTQPSPSTCPTPTIRRLRTHTISTRNPILRLHRPRTPPCNAASPPPSLTPQKLVVGQRLWGMVLETSNRGLTISLPHGLRGHVAPTEASDVLHKQLSAANGAAGREDEDGAAASKKRPRKSAASGAAPAPLPSLFSVGQFVRAVVVGLGGEGEEGAAGSGEGGRRMVALSLRLRKVCAGLTAGAVTEGAALPAVVKGVEDHGYTLSLGIKVRREAGLGCVLDGSGRG